MVERKSSRAYMLAWWYVEQPDVDFSFQSAWMRDHSRTFVKSPS